MARVRKFKVGDKVTLTRCGCRGVVEYTESPRLRTHEYGVRISNNCNGTRSHAIGYWEECFIERTPEPAPPRRTHRKSVAANGPKRRTRKKVKP